MGGAGFGILAVAYPEDTAHPTDPFQARVLPLRPE
jgi:hypothetical protein